MRKLTLLKIEILLIVLLGVLSSNKTNAQDKLDKSTIVPSMIKAMEWQEQHPIFAIAPTDWTNGAYYTGVTRAHQATQNQIFLAAIKTMGYRNEWKTYIRDYHADDVAISYAYLYLEMNTNRKNMVNLEPTESFLQKHLFEDNQWKTGEDKEKSILWWWCDALFMAPPVIVEYAKLKNDESYLDAMHKYYLETYNLLYDKKENLFARDNRFVWTGKETDIKEENGKKVFWSRGNGWVLGGLALILDTMPKDYKYRPFYEQLFKEMATKIKSLQQADGLWTTSLLYPESYAHGEVSGSGFFTFALAWGINNGLLNKDEYSLNVMRGWNALQKCQLENGMVGWVQNIGFDPRPADFDSWQNYGTGAFLLAGSEVLKLKD
ncbi:glycoside hydrolase family 88/105 protein [Namhaeicola litoreus]|uniref:Glycoside hydrolase family 105 protein n=1 Tax=Namhaeicola litoreus TaxID=1052145 RepID=A0ABW3Y3I2_9FLAO